MFTINGGKQHWRTYMNPFHIIHSPCIAISRKTNRRGLISRDPLWISRRAYHRHTSKKTMLTLEWFLHVIMNQDNKSEITNRCTRSRSMSSCQRNSWNLKIVNFRCDGISRDPLWISRRAYQRHPWKNIADLEWFLHSWVSPAIHYGSAAEYTTKKKTK